MGTLIEKRHFIKSDHKKNNNKFWNVEIYDDGEVTVRYGRVGDSGQSRTYQKGSEAAGRKFAESKIRSKLRSGRNGEIAYREIEIVEGGTTTQTAQKTVAKANLESVAKKQIKYNNPNVAKLITYLTKVNAHQISSATGGQITFNDTTGLFSTPMGIVTQGNIDDANDILVKIGDMVAKGRYTAKLGDLTNDYLMLVPQNIGRKRLDVNNFWSDLAKVQKQKSIVDALQASLVTATTQPGRKKTVKLPEEQVFDVQLDLVEDSKTLAHIKKMYGKTRQSRHACYHLDVKTIYKVDINTVRQAFELDGAKMDNIWELWHGTRASNLLSILKGGLVIPPASSSHCTGRMFGNGVYASDQSTKALNYAYGYWGGKADNNCFMFLLDMAMGNYHVPARYGSGFPVRNTDSTFAKANKSGVMNNEMIVYRTSQVNLKYLVEFSPNGK